MLSMLEDKAAYPAFLNMDVFDYDFLPKVSHIPEHLPNRRQNFILNKYKYTVIGRTYLFPTDPCKIYLGAVDEDSYAGHRVHSAPPQRSQVRFSAGSCTSTWWKT